MTKDCLWRISQFQDLSGIGGTKVAGRWHNKGRPIVYLGDCPAICLLEILVHMEGEPDELPEAFTLLRVELPSGAVSRAPTVDLDATWRDDLNITRRLGDDWLEAGESLLLRVPSAIVPHNMNFLLNPLHPEASKAALTSESFRLTDGFILRFDGEGQSRSENKTSPGSWINIRANELRTSPRCALCRLACPALPWSVVLSDAVEGG